MIRYDEFRKLDMKIGTVETAERVSGADNLLKLEVSLGEEKRQLVAGIAERYSPEQLSGKQIVVLVNLEPKTLRGVESQGMLLAADSEGGPVLLQPETKVDEGTGVK